MPIYEYECPECDHITEVIQTTYDYKESVPCKICGTEAPKAVSVPTMQPDDMWNGHYSVSLGRRFNSRREYNDYCKRNGFEASSARDRGAVESANRAKAAKDAKAKEERTRHVAQHVRDFMI
jgi:putative FmdB family regulatory protein